MCVIHKKGVFSLNMSPYSALCRHFPLLYLYQSNSCEFYPFSCNEHVSSSNIDYFMSLKMFIDFLNSIPILKALNRARGPVQWFWALRARKAVKSTPPPPPPKKSHMLEAFIPLSLPSAHSETFWLCRKGLRVRYFNSKHWPGPEGPWQVVFEACV